MLSIYFIFIYFIHFDEANVRLLFFIYKKKVSFLFILFINPYEIGLLLC